MNYPKTYNEAFNLLSIQYNDKAKYYIKLLEAEGYKEKNICYVISRYQDKLLQYKNDSRFWSILLNEVRKHAYK